MKISVLSGVFQFLHPSVHDLHCPLTALHGFILCAMIHAEDILKF